MRGKRETDRNWGGRFGERVTNPCFRGKGGGSSLRGSEGKRGGPPK